MPTLLGNLAGSPDDTAPGLHSLTQTLEPAGAALTHRPATTQRRATGTLAPPAGPRTPLEPRLLVADEAVSMLDPSEQAKMIQLLKHPQVERGMAMLFISHDLAVVLRIADRVLVMADGRIVEEGSGGAMLASPRQEVTRSLLAAGGRDRLFAGPE